MAKAFGRDTPAAVIEDAGAIVLGLIIILALAMSRRFDAIVIGAGQAGPPMAGRIAASGKTVALIERKLIGGTCVNTGCTPTKTLVASAYAAHLARRAADFGVTRRTRRRRFRGRHGPQGQGRRRLPLRPRSVAQGHGELHPL